jgi:hypothetical protein
MTLLRQERPKAANRCLISCAITLIYDQLVASFKTSNDPAAREESVVSAEISMQHTQLVAMTATRFILGTSYVPLKESVINLTFR